MRPRIAQELAFLRRIFGEVDYVEAEGSDWFRIQRYPFPQGWSVDGHPIEYGPILFMANASYPTGEPYGFWAPAGITFNGTSPNNVTQVENVAFGGLWTQFSWAPEGTWCTSSIIGAGSNLVDWALSFARRLKEGL